MGGECATSQEPSQRWPDTDLSTGQEALTTLSSRRQRVLSIAFVLTLALLQGAALTANAVQGLRLTTPYPAVTTSPDSRVTFDLSANATSAGRVDLQVTGVPASWTASLHGGGLVIGAVLLNGTDKADVRLDVDVPADATGTTRITVIASDASSRVELPLDIKVEANASGEVTVKPDYDALRGSADQSFTFNLNITNGKEQDLAYTATGQGPTGWTVDVTLTGQAQAVSGSVKAGSTAAAAVKVTPATSTAAGTYKVPVVATVGGQQFPIELEVDITGSYTLALSTPTQALSGHGPAGGITEQTFTITNTGTAPVTNVKLSSSAPTNWKVEFDQDTIASIAPDQPATVIAKITPSGDAIAGDYSLTFTATGAEANDNVAFRFTVETSIVGGLIGAGLIIAAIGGLLWVFRRYGRR
jgi:uncharacterized membrane protein